ncbi:replication associated protein [Gerygone associated gemycircularvirus 3]|uniref:Replication associated protein n=1 Tax=Gerygone associated gemycircularvirus 3 TaxID=1985383 RepID=T1YRW9_9VIRU|nr:replication associated protein [Gerygone associated gemycircularvirus 3]AGU67665.1 replication associated protein [Gerygone associated gemycircularvirus 3]
MPPKAKPNPYFADGRYFLLTYAQCGTLDAWTVNDHLAFLGAECIIGRELHADGGTHLHAFCDFSRRFRSRRSDVFDVGGRHPNLVPSYGKPEGGYDYAIKDGDVVAGGLSRPSGRGVYEDVSSWSIIVGQESEGEFWKCVARLDPRALCTNYNSLRAYANWRYRPAPVPYEHPAGIEFELGMVPELAVWREIALGADRERGILVIFGDTRLGKTLWARSIGPHIYTIGQMSGEVILRDGPDADYAVFDDMRGGLEFFHGWKEWFGCQSVVTVKKLYRDPVQMPWGKPVIWLSNRDPRDELRDSITNHTSMGKQASIEGDIKWLDGNCIFVELDHAIFRANTE